MCAGGRSGRRHEHEVVSAWCFSLYVAVKVGPQSCYRHRRWEVFLRVVLKTCVVVGLGKYLHLAERLHGSLGCLEALASKVRHDQGAEQVLPIVMRGVERVVATLLERKVAPARML